MEKGTFSLMDAYEYGELLKSLSKKMDNIKNIVKPDELQARLNEIEKMQQDQDFWNDATNAGKISQEKTKTERILATYSNANNAVDDAVDYFEMAKSEKDDETLEMLYEDADSLQESTNALEVQMMLSGEHDAANAIISIHPGAGGTESQDWASMLYRMYLRWAERHDFKVEVLDYQPAEEAGIKDVSFIIKGENAYGYLKVENGIHRLVRISPFDSNAKRHTSFSSVMVSPEVDDDIDIVIEDKDIRVGWGHQIRSYVMQPYQQVKDTRSNQAFTNVDAILDGDINKLLEGVLIAQAK
jgi:peptide chain release factor 2